MSWKAIRPQALLAGYGAAAVATFAAALTGGTGHPWAALALVALAGLAVASRMSLPEALVHGMMCWLFYDGFILGRHAHLAWHPIALVAAGACLAAGLLGAAVSTLRQRPGHDWHPGSREIEPVRDGVNVVSLAEVRRHREVRRTAS